MKILITGNSGYIGSHLTHLLKQEHEVYGLDIVQPAIPTTGFYNLDITEPWQLYHEFDCVIHLAALVKVGDSEIDPISYYQTNVMGTMNVLKIKTKNFIFASTGAAEKCYSPYGVSKRAAEDCVKQYCQTNNIPYTIFRFYNVIGSSIVGPTNPDGLFYKLIEATKTGKFSIYGGDYNTLDGTAVRDYVHVDEICHSIKLAVDNPTNSLENLGHGVGKTVKEIVQLFKTTNNVDFDVEVVERRAGDLERSVLDNPSVYMKKMFSFEELLKVVNNDESIS
jgi:UDP-glucose 4-epimerase